jgi:hypothetical protein
MESENIISQNSEIISLEKADSDVQPQSSLMDEEKKQ